MTAHLNEEELSGWLPVSFDDITDPLATPEPSKGALIQLDSGAYLVLYYGQDSQQLSVEIPEATSDASKLISAFLSEASLPPERILWHRKDITLPEEFAVSASPRRP